MPATTARLQGPGRRSSTPLQPGEAARQLLRGQHPAAWQPAAAGAPGAALPAACPLPSLQQSCFSCRVPSAGAPLALQPAIGANGGVRVAFTAQGPVHARLHRTCPAHVWVAVPGQRCQACAVQALCYGLRLKRLEGTHCTWKPAQQSHIVPSPQRRTCYSRDASCKRWMLQPAQPSSPAVAGPQQCSAADAAAGTAELQEATAALDDCTDWGAQLQQQTSAWPQGLWLASAWCAAEHYGPSSCSGKHKPLARGHSCA